MSTRYIFLFSFLLTLLFSCTKETVGTPDCGQVQNDIVAGDKEDVAAAINSVISSLSSQDYTEDNLNRLVTALGQTCGTTAKLLCFDCIKTLPTQTEIRVTVTSSGSIVNKTVDITYNSANKMVFQNLHD